MASLLDKTCFLCGLPTETSLSSDDLEMVLLFKTYLTGEDNSMETCATCFDEVTTVWNLNQQIAAIQKEIAIIVAKFGQGTHKELPKNAGNQVKDETVDDFGAVIVEVKAENCDDLERGVKMELETAESCFKTESIWDEESPLIIPDQSIGLDEEDTDSEQESGQESEFDPEEHSSQFTCAPCNKSYSNHNNLRAHLRLVHERAKPKSHKCGSCSKSFPKLAQLSQHVAWVHEQERWHCSICGKGLSSQRQWALHEVLVCKVADWSAERLKAEHGITLVNCPVEGCPKQFDSKRTTDMKLHISNHSQSQDPGIGEERDPLAMEEYNSGTGQNSEANPPLSDTTCPHCTRVYSTHKCLVAHIRRIHGGHRPHQCELCSKSYTGKKDLANHVNRAHSQDSQNTWCCSHCSKQLTTERHWVVHEATICQLQDKWSPEKLKEFNVTLVICPEQGCGKRYDSSRPTDYKRHIAIHSKSNAKTNAEGLAQRKAARKQESKKRQIFFM